MFRPRLLPTLLAFLATTAALSGPAWAAPVAADALARIQAIARQEGLPVQAIRVAGPQQLAIVSEGELSRDAFIKRASLLAYFVFKRVDAPFSEIAFTNNQAQAQQSCHIRLTDYGLYLRDHITKAEYERRLGYQQVSQPAGRTAKAPLPLPRVLPTLAPVLNPPLPSQPVVPVVAPASEAAVPASPRELWSPLVGFGYQIGFGNGSYDAYQVEYGYPVLKLLDVRPSLQIVSPFSPINFHAGAGQAMQGLSLACDLLGTSRQAPGVTGLCFDGGLGMRLSMLQSPGSANTDLWPAMHLRLGLHWHALAIGMRYPLLHSSNDPTAGWEASVGVAMPLSGL